MTLIKVAALLTLGAAVSLATPLALAQAKLKHGERKFLEEVAKGDMAEVGTGKLAGSKATNPEAKRFGQQMAQDHGKNYEEVVQLAKAKSISLPIEPDRAQKREADKLAKLSGAEFDRTYMKVMVKDHEKDVKEFRKMAKDAKDPDLKAFVDKTLPVLEGHLKMAREAEAATWGRAKH